jgi:hypothetical protein
MGYATTLAAYDAISAVIMRFNGTETVTMEKTLKAAQAELYCWLLDNKHLRPAE